jgi:hypothetical protein
MDRMIIFVAKIILITTMNINEEVHSSIRSHKEGGIILYPRYRLGIGCDDKF